MAKSIKQINLDASENFKDYTYIEALESYDSIMVLKDQIDNVVSQLKEKLLAFPIEADRYMADGRKVYVSEVNSNNVDLLVSLGEFDQLLTNAGEKDHTKYIKVSTSLNNTAVIKDYEKFPDEIKSVIKISSSKSTKVVRTAMTKTDLKEVAKHEEA